ncbi:MAG: hypothetical protein ACOX9R_14600 [Armatimonadota bacterium]|jgi:hypothetical protein
MIARLVAVIACVVVALQPALAAGLTVSTQFGPATIRLDGTKTLHATRRALVQLQQGETTILALPLDDLGIAADDAVIQLEPADAVRLVAVRTGPEGPRWVLQAAREMEATLSLTYPIQDLSWALEYAAVLGARGSLELEATLRLTSALDRDLPDARFVGEFARASLSLEAGQSITVEQPWLNATVAADDLTRRFVFDKARHGDAAVELLTVSGAAPVRATALPPGTVRLYTAPEAGREFIMQTSLAYLPPREPLELALGPASGILVKRSLEVSKEVDRRLDALNKVTLFDLQESWLLEIRNLREEPVDLLIRERHEGAWTLEQSSEECERVDAETLIFNATVAPGERRQITFRLRHHNRQP